MTEMDGRDIAKCQKSKKGDISGIIGKFNEEKDKIGTSGCLLQKLKRAVAGVGQWLGLFIFLERESTISLDFRSIGSSVFDGARSKVALRGEG